MSFFKPHMLFLIPLLPLIGALINGSLAMYSARTGKKISEGLVSFIGVLLPVGAFAVSVLAFFALKANPEHAAITTGSLFTWIDSSLVVAGFGLLLDPLSAIMILIVTGVGSLIHLYSVGYMKGDEGFARYFAYINLFLFFMLLLVLGENLLVLFVGWEGVGLASYLLIGFWFTDEAKAAAGKKAFIVNRIGDFGFLIGIFFILYAFSSQVNSSEKTFLDFAFMRAHAEIFTPFAAVITLCLFIGATGKSAQIPLYVWLPDAMAGPTPVSALIHAATMVTAGIYMIIKLNFLFILSPLTLDVIASIGLATAVMAALIGLTQYDIKKVLAYSTVSQLGFMFLALGARASEAALFHLMTHAFFKACLFLGSGSVIHAVHTQDIREMGGLGKKMPVTFWTFLISTIAIAGIPPFSGFFSKDEILLNTFLNVSPMYYGIAVFAAGCTAFYMFRLVAYTFLGKIRNKHPEHIHESPWVMTLPLIILALLAVGGGIVGIPEILGGHNHLHHWLTGFGLSAGHPEVSHALEWQLMGLATAVAVVMSLLAVILYTRNLDWAAGLKKRLKSIHVVISHKFFVDEIYELLIIKPLIAVSRLGLWKGSDQKFIDGFLVHGVGSVAQAGARVVSFFQTGLLGHYLLYLWLGLVGLLYLAVK